ncbi:MAG: tetratricopeptide repeat protein [Bacteroidota bacterium]
MEKIIKRAIFGMVFSLFSLNVISQDALIKGWESFLTNDLENAKTLFTKATSDAGSKAEAYLGLSMINSMTDSYTAAFENFMNFYDNSTAPDPYLYALWNTEALVYNYSEITPEKAAFIKKIAEKTETNATIKALAWATLGYYYNHIKQEKLSKTAYDNIGAVSDWQGVGSFENISGSGFDKNYDPIKYTDNAKAFKNKYNADVFWFDLPVMRNDRWVDLSYNFYVTNAVIYAQSFVDSPSDQYVQLRIGTSGSVKVWVNDMIVFSESEERNNDIDTYIVKIKLSKGSNRILVQLGASEIENMNFLLRFTDDSGSLITNLTYNKEPKEYKKDSSYTPEVIRNFSEKYFEDLIKKEPEKVIYYLLLSDLYSRNEKTYEARKTLLKAKELAPKSSYIVYKLISIYLKDENNTDLTASLEWLKDNDPDSYFALILQYQEELDKESYTKAEEILDKMESSFGVSGYTTMKRISLLAYQQKQEDMIKLIEKSYKSYPDNYDFVSMKHALESDMKKNYKTGIAVLKKYLKKFNSTDAVSSLANDYFNSGNITTGIETFKGLIDKYPYSSGYINSMGNIYFQLQMYDEAAKWYLRNLEYSPYIGTYWGNLAEAYDNDGKTDEAIEAYKKCITYYPTNYEKRKKLRKLEGKKEIYDFFEEPDIDSIVKKAPDASEYPEDNSVILYDEMQKVVYSGGTSEQKEICLIKVLNADGVKTWKDYYVYHTNMQRVIIEKAEVIKSNGSKVEAESEDENIVFNSLEPGDVINLSYRTENYLTGKLSPYFWDKYYFSGSVPLLKTKYNLLIAPDIKFDVKFSKEEIQSTKTSLGEFDMYTWEASIRPSIKTEDKMPEFSDVANALFLSSFPDWNYISNWYYDLSSTKTKADFEVKDAVNKIFEGKENLTKLEKAKEIYKYIVTNIHYNSVSFLRSSLIPQKASTVLNTKYGDCKDISTLFVAMCKEAGIDASLVLVDTRDNGSNDMMLPSIDFNHVIAKATIDGKDYYCELTSDYLPFNTFDEYELGSLALEVISENNAVKADTEFFNPTVRSKNSIYRTGSVTIDGSDLVIEKTNIKTGRFASNMRQTYRDLGVKEQEKNMLSALTGEYPNVQLNSLEFTGLKGVSDTVTYKYNYTGSNALTDITGMQLFTLPWASKADPKDFIFNKKREYPIDLYLFANSDSNIEFLTVKIPAGKTLAETPKSCTYSCSIADYSITYKVTNSKTIEAKRELKYKQKLIPLSKIDEFAEFYKKVISADAKQIAIK